MPRIAEATATALAKTNKVANSYAFARIYDACLQGIAMACHCSLNVVVFIAYIYSCHDVRPALHIFYTIQRKTLKRLFYAHLLPRCLAGSLRRIVSSCVYDMRANCWQVCLFVILLHWIKLNGWAVECQKWFRMRIQRHWTDQCERWRTECLTGWVEERSGECWCVALRTHIKVISICVTYKFMLKYLSCIYTYINIY